MLRNKPDTPRRPDVAALDAAHRQLGLSALDLWVKYFALGGRFDVGGLGAYLDPTLREASGATAGR